MRIFTVSQTRCTPFRGKLGRFEVRDRFKSLKKRSEMLSAVLPEKEGKLHVLCPTGLCNCFESVVYSLCSPPWLDRLCWPNPAPPTRNVHCPPSFGGISICS
jgi:hypothetical protein